MDITRRALLGLALAGALACHGEADTTTPSDAAPSDDEAGARAPLPPASVRFASHGVPHSSPITGVVLSLDGRAALTRDSSGSVRLWTALDGSSEPLVVPLRDPKLMAIEATDDGGFTLALGDAAGGVKVIGVDADGEMRKLASLSPTDPIIELAVVPGGERILAIGADHVLRLLDRSGQTLAQLDEPGLRVASLRLATGPSSTDPSTGPSTDDARPELRVVALTEGETDPEVRRLRFEALTLEVGEASLARGPWTQTFHLDGLPSPDNPALSPDGRALVFAEALTPGSSQWRVVAKQLDDGRQVSVEVALANNLRPQMTLLAGGRVMVDDSSGIGRVVDLAARTVTLRGLRAAPTLSPGASATRPSLRVTPAGTWLAVHELAEDELAYLGYEPISVVHAGLAPAADHVAWALDQRVLVEAARGPAAEAFEVPMTGPSSRPRSFRLAEFLDPDHLVLLDFGDALEVVEWRSGEVVDAVDLGNGSQQATLARAPGLSASGVLVIRTNLWANPTLVELRDGQIGARYIAQAPSSLVGPLIGDPGDLDSWGMWTLDGSAKLRELELGELAAGLTLDAELARGEILEQGMPEHFAQTGDGTRYWIRSPGGLPELHADRGAPSEGAVQDATLSTGFVILLAPSLDGSKLAIVQQRDPNQILTIYDATSLEPLWARPVPMVSTLSWSDGGEGLAVATAMTGGAVFDGASGEPLNARCGLAFQRRHAAPLLNMGASPLPNLCEL